MIRSVLKRKYVLFKNSYGNSQFVVLLFLLVSLVSGCVHQVPRYQPLSMKQQTQARRLLANMQQRQKINVLDADVTVTWSGYGRKLRFRGGLQAVRKGRIRLSALDPLGRPIFLVVLHDASFTFLDTRRGRGYMGPVDSDFFHKYIPACVTPATLFSFLTAQLPDIDIGNVSIGQGDREGCYVYTFPFIQNLKRMAEVDALSGVVFRQMIVDETGKLIVDIHYHGHTMACKINGQTKPIILPAYIRIEGNLLPGSIVIAIDTLYAKNDLPTSLFTLAIPEYFSIIHVK